jgi:hypothetical protein
MEKVRIVKSTKVLMRLYKATAMPANFETIRTVVIDFNVET